MEAEIRAVYWGVGAQEEETETAVGREVRMEVGVVVGVATRVDFEAEEVMEEATPEMLVVHSVVGSK